MEVSKMSHELNRRITVRYTHKLFSVVFQRGTYTYQHRLLLLVLIK